MKIISKLPGITTVAISLSSSLLALELPTIFSDNMVLQRNQELPVWGESTPGSVVSVRFGEQSLTTTTNTQGSWKITLAALEASAVPATLEVSTGDQSVTFSNVLVGEVWLCSGQSNMEWSLTRAADNKTHIEAATDPLLRLYHSPKVASPHPLPRIEASWNVCQPNQAKDFSAVAYHFAQRLRKELDVPVGLIQSAWGGTIVEPWTPPVGFTKFKSLQRYSKELSNTPDTASADYKKKVKAYLKDSQKWIARAQLAVDAGKPVAPAPPFPFNVSPRKPSQLFNGMIHAHIPFAIKGAIWYQGESNRNDGLAYTEKFSALIQGWRELWGYELPFHFVQIAPYQYGNDPYDKLPTLWQAQTNVVNSLPGVHMTSISDVAALDDIHPSDKVTPGRRLAGLALKYNYSKNDLLVDNPSFESLKTQGASLQISFKHAQGLKTNNGQPPSHFEIAGKDGKFHPATAKIQGTTVTLSSDKVSAPQRARLGWHKTAQPNLVNQAGLPAAPFQQ